MIRQLGTCFGCFVTAIYFVALPYAAAQYAVEVVSYDMGTTPWIDFESGLPMDLTSSALGEPSRYTADPFFPGAVSPFNAPYKRSQLITVGESGHLTLRLSNYVVPQPGGKEIGVFAHAGIIDDAWPTGHAGSPAAPYGLDRALVEMSADGLTWLPVGAGATLFDLPTNGYTDVTDAYNPLPGSALSDFQEPFTGSISDFDALPYYDAGGPDALEVLAGSGGGNWLDIPLGLANVGFIRFRVDDDGNAMSELNFELDAVSIAHGAAGAATAPEPATIGLFALALAAGAMRFRRRNL